MTVDTSAADASAERHPWRLVGVLGAIYMCAFVDRNILSLLVEPMKADLHVTDLQVSLLLGIAFSLFYTVLNVPAGLLIDRHGRRGLIAGAASCWSTMTIICGLAASYWQLFLGRVGVGVAEAVITPAAFSLIRDRLPPEKRGRAFSFLAMAPYIGSGIALAGGGALIAAANAGHFAGWPLLAALRPWQIVLVLVGVAGLPLPLLLWLVAPDRRSAALRDASVDQGFAGAFAHIRANARIYAMLVAYATMGAMIAFGTGAWIPTVMGRTFGVPIAQVGVISGPILLVTSISGLILCGLVLDRLVASGRSLLWYGGIAMVLAGGSAMLIALAPTVTVAWVLYGVSTFFGGTFYSVGATVLSRITPGTMMGKVTALYLLCQNLVGSGLGPSLVALFAGAVFTGTRAMGMALSLYCGLVALGGLLVAIGLARALHQANGVTADGAQPPLVKPLATL